MMPEPDNKDKTQEFMALLVSNQRKIQAFVAYMVPNRSDSEDILQDTLTEMWNKFDDYKEGSNFVAWGKMIAKYKILSYQKKYKKSKLQFNLQTSELLQSQAESDSGLLEEQLDILQLCIKKLSENEKKYLRMRYEKSLTLQGIAERYGISMQGVYKAITSIQCRLLKCVRLKMKTEGLL